MRATRISDQVPFKNDDPFGTFCTAIMSTLCKTQKSAKMVSPRLLSEKEVLDYAWIMSETASGRSSCAQASPGEPVAHLFHNMTGIYTKLSTCIMRLSHGYYE